MRFEAESLPVLQKDPNANVVMKPTEAYLQLQFRLGFNDGRTTPFANPLVRQAVRFAIDQKKINDVVQLGEGTVAGQALPEESPGYNPAIGERLSVQPRRSETVTRRGRATRTGSSSRW